MDHNAAVYLTIQTSPFISNSETLHELLNYSTSTAHNVIQNRKPTDIYARITTKLMTKSTLNTKINQNL